MSNKLNINAGKPSSNLVEIFQKNAENIKSGSVVVLYDTKTKQTQMIGRAGNKPLDIFDKAKVWFQTKFGSSQRLEKFLATEIESKFKNVEDDFHKLTDELKNGTINKDTFLNKLNLIKTAIGTQIAKGRIVEQYEPLFKNEAIQQLFDNDRDRIERRPASNSAEKRLMDIKNQLTEAHDKVFLEIFTLSPKLTTYSDLVDQWDNLGKLEGQEQQEASNKFVDSYLKNFNKLTPELQTTLDNKVEGKTIALLTNSTSYETSKLKDSLDEIKSKVQNVIAEGSDSEVSTLASNLKDWKLNNDNFLTYLNARLNKFTETHPGNDEYQTISAGLLTHAKETAKEFPQLLKSLTDHLENRKLIIEKEIKDQKTKLDGLKNSFENLKSAGNLSDSTLRNFIGDLKQEEIKQQHKLDLMHHDLSKLKGSKEYIIEEFLLDHDEFSTDASKVAEAKLDKAAATIEGIEKRMAQYKIKGDPWSITESQWFPNALSNKFDKELEKWNLSVNKATEGSTENAPIKMPSELVKLSDRVEQSHKHMQKLLLERDAILSDPETIKSTKRLVELNKTYKDLPNLIDEETKRYIGLDHQIQSCLALINSNQGFNGTQAVREIAAELQSKIISLNFDTSQEMKLSANRDTFNALQDLVENV